MGLLFHASIKQIFFERHRQNGINIVQYEKIAGRSIGAMEKVIAEHKLPTPVSVTSVYSLYRTLLFGKTIHVYSYDFPELFYVYDTASPHVMISNGSAYSLNKGQMILLPPNSNHTGPSSEAVVYMIAFDAVFPEMEKLYQQVITLDGRQKQQLEQIITLGRHILENIPEKGYQVGNSLHERTDAFELQKFKNLFEIFLIELYQKEIQNISNAACRFPNEEIFDGLVSYLKRNIDKRLTLDDLSKATLVSVAKIRKLFYKKHSCSPMQYFNQLKIEAAIELMCSTSLSYAEIASRLGFSSAAYFSRLFKKKTGLSPSEYIKALKNTH